MTTTEKLKGYPIEIGTSSIQGPQYLMPWVQMIAAYITPQGTFSPTALSAEVLNGLLAAGWAPPNDPSDDDNEVDDGPSEADIAAREVADLVWRATTCHDDQKPGIQALTIEALHRYRKKIV